MGRCLQDDDEEMLAIIRNNPRFLGCFVDVLQIFDRKCSGKNQCDVYFMSDPDIQKEKPCQSSLRSYLEASYDCVTGKL